MDRQHQEFLDEVHANWRRAKFSAVLSCALIAACGGGEEEPAAVAPDAHLQPIQCADRVGACS